MDENSIPASLSESSDASATSSAEEFLKTEYELLNAWAVHGEDVAHRIFNFYITVLTAVLGGLLVLIQVFSPDAQVSLIIVAGACGFLLLIGVVFFDALISQYVRNAYYHIGMQAIRAHFRRYQTVASSLLQDPSFLPEEEGEPASQYLVSVKFGFPGGNQLSLIEGLNSLMMAVLIWSLLWGIGGVGFHPFGTGLASVVSALISLIAHKMLANLTIKQNVAQMKPGLSVQNAPKTASPDIDDSVSPPKQDMDSEPSKQEDDGNRNDC